MTIYPHLDAVHALRDQVLDLGARRQAASPAAWANAHNHQPGSGDEFCRLLTLDCQHAGISAGVNGKRGNVADLSQDVIALPVQTGGARDDGPRRFPGVAIIDVIAGAGGGHPTLAWIDVTGATIAGGSSGAWVAPVHHGWTPLGSTLPPETPRPPTPPPAPARPALPPDAELADLHETLNAYYRDRLTRPPHAWHVDPIGLGRWAWDYQDLRAQGQTHQAAVDEVMRRIVAITGVPR